MPRKFHHGQQWLLTPWDALLLDNFDFRELNFEAKRLVQYLIHSVLINFQCIDVPFRVSLPLLVLCICLFLIYSINLVSFLILNPLILYIKRRLIQNNLSSWTVSIVSSSSVQSIAEWSMCFLCYDTVNTYIENTRFL